MKRLTTLLFASLFCLAGFSQTFISEDFTNYIDTITPPTGWKNVDSTTTQNGQIWRFDNPGNQTLNSPITNPAAILDSDWYGFGTDQDAYLESPSFDASLATTVTLEFDHYFQAITGSYGLVEVFDGSKWVLVDSITTSPDPEHKIIDISSEAAGTANAQVRFRYVGSYGWYWIVDNVEVFQPVPDDIKVVSVDSLKNGCGLTATESITATITNVGSTTIMGGIDLNYTVNGGTIVTETVTNTLIPGDTVIYTFTTTADLSAVTTYNIEVISTLRSDANFINDTARGTSIHKPSISTFPYFEDFESGAGSWTSAGTNSSWAHGTPIGTVISSASSGNNAWVTNLSGNYNNSEESYVISPCFDLSSVNAPQFKMMIWVENEEFWDGTVLQSSINGGQSWQKVGDFGDPNNWYNDNAIDGLINIEPSQEGWTGDNTNSGTNGWVLAEHDLTGLGGQSSVELRIVHGSDGIINQEGFAFDDVLIQEAPASDVAVLSLQSPSTSACGLGSADSIKLSILNAGSAPISNIEVAFSLNQGSLKYDTIRSTINPGDTIIFAHDSTVDLSAIGSYTLLAYSALSNDGNNLNDTLNTTFNHIPLVNTFPYSEDFENGNGGWTTDGTNNSWALGTPAATIINSAASGSNSWVTNLSGNYNGDEASYVIGPCFDFTSLVEPQIKMNIWWNSEFSWDGAVLQSSIDGGVSWQKVGAFGDPKNWYTDTTINGLGAAYSNLEPSEEGWTGRNSTSNGSGTWVLSENALSGLGGESSVLLRIAFASDDFVQDEGIAFDDVTIIEKPSDDLGMISMIRPVEGCGLTGSDSVEVSLANYGLNYATNFDLSYVLNGAAAVVESYTDTIFPGDTVTYTFNTLANVSAQGTYNFTIYSNLANDSYNINDTIVDSISNRPVVSLPFVDDFETGAANAAFKFTTNPESKVNVYASAANNSLYGLALEGNSATNYITPTATNVWTTNPEHFASAEFCLDLTNVSTVDLSYDLQQGFNFNDFYTNFRITVDGNQVGATHRPAGATTPWINIKESLNAYAGSIVNVALESMVKYDTLSPNYNWVDNLIVQVPAAFDAGVISLDAPGSSCGFSNSDSVKISIKNFGANVISNFDVSYVLNGASPVTATFTGSIQPGDTAQFTFSTAVNLSTPGTYTFDIYSSLTNDGNSLNDTLSGVEVENSIKSLPYYETFDSFTSGTGFDNAGSVLMNGWRGQPAASPDYFWGARQGATGSTGTGPDHDNTNDTTIYVFIEASNGIAGDTAVIYSPCIDVSGAASVLTLDYAYHMYGADIQTLFVDIDSAGTWVNVDTLIGQKHLAPGDPYTSQAINLNQFAGLSQTQIRFWSVKNAFAGDIAIDDFAITTFPVGIENDNTSIPAFNVYPNPSNGLFKVSVNQDMNVQALEVRDIAGKLVHELSPERSSANYNLDLNHLPKGVYMLKVRGKIQSETVKLIIQ